MAYKQPGDWGLTLVKIYRVDQKSKLLYFFHIFAKYWQISTTFSPVDSGRNLLLGDMHTTPLCRYTTL